MRISNFQSVAPLFLGLAFAAQVQAADLKQVKSVSFGDCGPSSSVDACFSYSGTPLVLNNSTVYFRTVSALWKFNPQTAQPPVAITNVERSGDSVEGSYPSPFLTKDHQIAFGNMTDDFYLLNLSGTTLFDVEIDELLSKTKSPAGLDSLIATPLQAQNGTFVGASRSTVWFLDSKMKLVNRYDVSTWNSRFATSPIQLKDGQIYVSDTGAATSYFFSPDGNLNTSISNAPDRYNSSMGGWSAFGEAVQTQSGLIAQGGNGYMTFLTSDGKISSKTEFPGVDFVLKPLLLSNGNVVAFTEIDSGTNILGQASIFLFDSNGKLLQQKTLARDFMINAGAAVLSGDQIVVGGFAVTSDPNAAGFGVLAVLDSNLDVVAQTKTTGFISGMSLLHDGSFLTNEYGAPSTVGIYRLTQ